MEFQLTRFGKSDNFTAGILESSDNKIHLCTLEKPWKENQRMISCVPTGFYILEPHSSNKYPDVFALVGSTVSHYPNGKQRDAVLIHVANLAEELQGCIALGIQFGFIGNKFGVLNSRKALDAFRKVVKGEEWNALTITSNFQY